MDLRGTDIVCIGFADWDAELWTNQQHLMSRLATNCRVLFVESLGLRRPRLAGRDLRRMARRLLRSARGVRTVGEVHVLSPLVLPWHSKGWQKTLNRHLLQWQVSRARCRLGMSRVLLWAYVPQAVDLVEAVDAERVLYHCVDDIAHQKGVDAAAFAEQEQRLLRRADLVLASAANLYERLSRTRPVRFAPNVADTEHFSAALDAGPVDAALGALPGPRIVFVGAVVATKLDIGLIVATARERPDWSFALVGPVGAGDPSTDVSRLEQEQNIHLLGARRLDELPAVLRGASVGWIPYEINDLTRSVFPMKVYEYLSAGLGVVSTRLPAIAGVTDVRIADTPGQSVIELGSAIDDNSADRRSERSRLAMSNSWANRLAEISYWLGKT